METLREKISRFSPAENDLSSVKDGYLYLKEKLRWVTDNMQREELDKLNGSLSEDKNTEEIYSEAVDQTKGLISILERPLFSDTETAKDTLRTLTRLLSEIKELTTKQKNMRQ